MRKAALLIISFVCSLAFGQKSVTFNAMLSNDETATFEVNEKAKDEVALVMAKNNGKSILEIPSTITNNGKTYKVTVLGTSSLKDCDKNLRELIIPSTVREIQSFLFFNDSKLSQVFKFAGRKSPINGVKLSNLKIGKGVKTIGENAFITYYGGINKSGNSKYISAKISELPGFVTLDNAQYYGLDVACVKEFRDGIGPDPDPDPDPIPGPINDPIGYVDIKIPRNPTVNKKTFAIIIANENYQRESKVDFAINDGNTFKTYCNRTLGLPQQNIHFVKDATLNNIIYELDWIKQVCEAYKGSADVIIYYAGHGVPNEKDGKAYLLPADGSGQNPRTCYSLDNFYKTVGELQAAHVTIFLDACFSGAKRDGEMQKNARGVAIKAKSAAVPQGNMVILSAATGDETAYSFKEQGHGLFTYFLLKKLKDTKGNVSLGDLSDYVINEVSQLSIVENGKSQTPTVSNSKDLQLTWRSKKLK